ncbi:MAG: hypothetical protein ABI565_09445 [Vicinamibacteria bacterium]
MTSSPTSQDPSLPKTLRPAAFILFMFGCTALGYLMGKIGAQPPLIRGPLRSLTALDLIALPWIGLLVLAVHEGGHLLGGFRRGMRFLLFIVGPFQLSRTPNGIRFNWIFNLGAMGGLAAASPDPNRPLLPQLRSLIAGGPLASLVLAIVGLGFGLIGPGRGGAYLFVIGGLSFLIFLATATPLRAGGFMSDGMQFIEVMRGGRCVEERQVLITLMAQSLAGTRPRELDQAAIAQALSFDSAEPVRRIAARLYAYYAAVDRGGSDARVHASWLGDHIDGFLDGFRQAIALELAFHEAGLGNLEASRRWMARTRGGVVDASRRALAEASLARLEGDAEGARRLLALSTAKLSRSMDPGLNVLTAEQIVRAEAGMGAGEPHAA